MNEDQKKHPECDQCGRCCQGPMVLITKLSDYERWITEDRTDILRYANKPLPGEYGDLWGDSLEAENQQYCPFIARNETGGFYCSIEETKPDVCREFYCEWSYGIGKKGIPFHTEMGWTDSAKKLGFG